MKQKLEELSDADFATIVRSVLVNIEAKDKNL